LYTVLDESAFNITESEYSKKKCVTINFLRPARIFTDEINANEKDKLLESVKTYTAEIAELEKRIKSREPKLRDLEREMAEIDNEMQNIHAKKEHFKQVESKLQNAIQSLEMLEGEKLDIETLKQTVDQQILVFAKLNLFLNIRYEDGIQNICVICVLSLQSHRMELLNSTEWMAEELNKISRSGSKLIVIKKQLSTLQSRLVTKKNELTEAEGTIKDLVVSCV